MKDIPKYKKSEKCIQCNRRRKPLDESHKICQICYKSDTLYKPSGNEFVDDFIRNSQINSLIVDMMEFVSYDQLKDIKHISEVKAYKATWIDGNIQSWNKKEISFKRSGSMQVILKKLDNSENVTLQELYKVQYSIYNLIIIYPNIMY